MYVCVCEQLTTITQRSALIYYGTVLSSYYIYSNFPLDIYNSLINLINVYYLYNSVYFVVY